MALRNILKEGDETLTKRCRPVTEFNDRLHVLLDDMAETMAQADGVGLAGPQVGVLRRVVVVLETNTPEGEEHVIELVNPQILETRGEQEAPEGCLSFPGEFGLVKRPTWVKLRAQDRYGNWFKAVGEGLTARAFCHECDHLDGHVFKELCDHILTPEELEQYRDGQEDGQDE